MIKQSDFANIKAILFDKDGTLYDFHFSWSSWTLRLIEIIGKNYNVEKSRLAHIFGFDIKTNTFKKNSHFIAGTLSETVANLSKIIPNETPANLEEFLITEASKQNQWPVEGLEDTLKKLSSAGFFLGVATNDAEAVAIIHLQRSNIYNYFKFVAGYDSGYGSKPDPGQIIAFCQKMNVMPSEVIMVGDSTHDLIASQRAGTISVGVLTGLATIEDLTPYSLNILRSIKDLPSLIS